MKLNCLLGRHWPVAAFSPARFGRAHCRCADCGTRMTKEHVADWRAADEAQNWLMYSGGYFSQRYSPLKQIDRTNVTRLAIAWTYDLAFETCRTGESHRGGSSPRDSSMAVVFCLWEIRVSITLPTKTMLTLPALS